MTTIAEAQQILKSYNAITFVKDGGLGVEVRAIARTSTKNSTMRFYLCSSYCQEGVLIRLASMISHLDTSSDERPYPFGLAMKDAHQLGLTQCFLEG
jgi:hypothetical protein